MEYNQIIEQINKARTLLNEQKYQEALDITLEILNIEKIDDYHEELLISLITIALCYQGLQNYDETIWYCQEFIKVDPSYAEPYLILAEVYTDMAMYTLADVMVDAAFKHGSQHEDNVESLNIWAYKIYTIASLCKFNVNDMGQAIEYFDKGYKVCSDKSELIKNMNTLLERQINQNKELLENLSE